MAMSQTIIQLTILMASHCLGQVSPSCSSPVLSADPGECCRSGELIDRTTFIDCKTKFLMPQYNEKTVPTGSCFSECLLNATEVLRHGDIDQESAIKHLTERVATDPTMVAVVLDGISRCRNEVLMKRADYELILTLPPPPNGIRICNPMADHFVACLYSHTFRNCPISNWISTAACETMKEHFNRCPLPFPIRSE